MGRIKNIESMRAVQLVEFTLNTKSYYCFVRHENSVRQVVQLTAVAIATGYVREDPFLTGGIRRKLGNYYNSWRQFAAVVDHSSSRFCRSCIFLPIWS
ncbi:hypothetical protein AVEN_124559-1 [Araneus ventricosus]|uniref:Uncharacterized protein n=1 Tax=Araneus ventricosus TaxID=182803 RepID=A0A4Y2HTQ9_ARAVE|nr:hypothetical protein AVEN_124559-1 [Araneus ventricosus]